MMTPAEMVAERVRLFGRDLLGSGEAAYTMAHNAAAMPLAGVGGLVAGAIRGEDPKAAANKYHAQMAYEPRTDEARAQLDTIGSVMEKAKIPPWPIVGNMRLPKVGSGGLAGAEQAAETVARPIMPPNAARAHVVPPMRPEMLDVRKEVVKRLREDKAAPLAPPGTMDMSPTGAMAAGKRAQKNIDVGSRLDSPILDKDGNPITKPDLRGYTMFDYENLGRDPNVPQYSLLRPQPAQGKFEKVPDPIQHMVADPYVFKNMEKAMLRGEGWKNWYDLRPYREALMNEGMSRADFDRYMQYQQAAAQNVSPVKQAQIGNYLWSQDKSGLIVPSKEIVFPPGYGSKSQKSIGKNAQGIAAGKPIDSEKLLSYGENYGGNWAPGTMDTHGVRLPAMLSGDPRLLVQGLREKSSPGLTESLKGFPNVRQTPDEKYTMWSPREAYEAGKLPMKTAMDRSGLWYTVPSGSSYGAIEQYLYNPLASKLGMDVGQSQASAWVGGGGVTGLRAPPKLMLQMMEDETRRLMREHSMTQAQAIRAIAQGTKY
jgi:hypothetical protein